MSEDHFPDRARVYSDPVILYVLTRDEHAQMLKSRFDRQITELEDLARRELELLEENERLERLDGAELQKDENRKRLETQQQEEAETQRRMDDLTAADGAIDEGRRPQRRHRQKNAQENGGVPQVDAGTLPTGHPQG